MRKGRGPGGGWREETDGTKGFTSINQKKLLLFDSPLFCQSVGGYERPQKKRLHTPPTHRYHNKKKLSHCTSRVYANHNPTKRDMGTTQEAIARRRKLDSHLKNKNHHHHQKKKKSGGGNQIKNKSKQKKGKKKRREEKRREVRKVTTAGQGVQHSPAHQQQQQQWCCNWVCLLQNYCKQRWGPHLDLSGWGTKTQHSHFSLSFPSLSLSLLHCSCTANLCALWAHSKGLPFGLPTTPSSPRAQELSFL